jgi:hypothetical protein
VRSARCLHFPPQGHTGAVGISHLGVGGVGAPFLQGFEEDEEPRDVGVLGRVLRPPSPH